MGAPRPIEDVTTVPCHRRLGTWLAAYVALLLVVYVAYAGTLDQFFIADDFAHLGSLREVRAPLYRYLDPTFSYSDPVTRARYVPLQMFVLLALTRSFGLHAAAYHAVSIAVHAANALLVGHLSRVVLRSAAAGALSALLFAVTRVNAQNVCWMGCIPNLVGTTLVFSSVALYLRRRGLASWLLGPILLVASLLCRSDFVVAVAFLIPLWARDAILRRRRSAARFAILAFAGTGAVLVLERISLQHFPEPRMEMGVAPRRFFAFLADLFAPWVAPPAIKAAVVIGVLGAAALTRDRRLVYALYGIALGAIFWTVVVYLALSPRYLYAYTALSAMVLASLLCRTHRRAATWIGERAALLVALTIGMLWCGWNVREVRRREVVWFDYLSTPTRTLALLHDQQRALGATVPLRVRMAPYLLLGKRDMAFFAPALQIVDDDTAAVTVDTEAARYARHYGEDFGKAYWYYPWLER
jgi:hypothetical protein